MDAIAKARQLLTPQQSTPAAWQIIGAASLAAMAAVLMAGMMVVGPGVQLQEAVPAQPLFSNG